METTQTLIDMRIKAIRERQLELLDRLGRDIEPDEHAAVTKELDEVWSELKEYKKHRADVAQIAADELTTANEELKEVTAAANEAGGAPNDFAQIAKKIPTRETAAAAVAASEVDYFPKMRRLAIKDVATLAKIIGSNLKEIMPVLAPVLNDGAKLSPDLLITTIQTQLPHLVGDFMKIVVDVSGVDSEDEFMSAPLEALPYFINRLLSENNLTGFLTQAFKLAESYTSKPTSPQAHTGF